MRQRSAGESRGWGAPGGARCESLERRQLLATFANINFQPALSPVPAGYLLDGGLVYASRGNGFTYGWNIDTSAETRDRDSAASPDQRYDTFIHLQKPINPNAVWELAVPNGLYEVHAVSGDAIATDSVFKIDVEGTLVVSGVPSTNVRWLEGTSIVTVTDGKLTVRSGAGASNNKLNFLDISTFAPIVSVVASDRWASEARGVADRGPVDEFKLVNPGSFTITRSLVTTSPLVVQFSISGTGTSGSDYTPITTSATIPANAASVEVKVNPLDDLLFERADTVILTLTPQPAYVLNSPNVASVSIVDNETSNTQPDAPIITEPLNEAEVVSGFDVHMEIAPMVDPNIHDVRLSTDWQIWTTTGSPVRVWSKSNAIGESDRHIHFGDGTFEGPLVGQNKLNPDTNYQLRTRTRDNSGEALTEYSDWSFRNFHTLIEEPPTAAGWVARQAGYVIEEIPFTFPVNELNWRLPVSMAFVPEALRGSHPLDPLFYVNELYGQIRVVTNNYTVRTYASSLLNYNPNGPFSGTGENGMGGLAIDPTNGDLYITALYDAPGDGSSATFPKVTRLTSTDGGLTASTITDILKMPGESMLQSHIISDISFGPDGKLYVHVGDGFDANLAQDPLRFKGKILRLNKDGTAPPDNPQYNPADRNNDGLPDAEDYWWARGVRNPFGGAWRDANPGAGFPAQHFIAENGPSLDRLSMLVRDRNYLYDGSNASMQNFNIAYSPSGSFENGAPDWNPAPAPIDMAFLQASDDANFGGFPSSKHGHAFIAVSGSTHGAGPNAFKAIQEWTITPDGNRRVSSGAEPANPRELVSYEGAGYHTAAGIAVGPGGLYFTTLYPDSDPNPVNPGAKVLRVVYNPARAARIAAETAAKAQAIAETGPRAPQTALRGAAPRTFPSDFVGPVRRAELPTASATKVEATDFTLAHFQWAPAAFVRAEVFSNRAMASTLNEPDELVDELSL